MKYLKKSTMAFIFASALLPACGESNKCNVETDCNVPESLGTCQGTKQCQELCGMAPEKENVKYECWKKALKGYWLTEVSDSNSDT